MMKNGQFGTPILSYIYLQCFVYISTSKSHNIRILRNSPRQEISQEKSANSGIDLLFASIILNVKLDVMVLRCIRAAAKKLSQKYSFKSKRGIWGEATGSTRRGK